VITYRRYYDLPLLPSDIHLVENLSGLTSPM
jgi:hypothetical protein